MGFLEGLLNGFLVGARGDGVGRAVAGAALVGAVVLIEAFVGVNDGEAVGAAVGTPVRGTRSFPGSDDGIIVGVGAAVTSESSVTRAPRSVLCCAPTGTVAMANIVATMAATVERQVIFMAIGRWLGVGSCRRRTAQARDL